MDRYIDLHMHTTCSDGAHEPEHVLALVRHTHLVAFSITDHDTFEGYFAIEALLAPSDPELITGIELSVAVDGADLHLLAYMVDPEDESFQEALSGFQKKRNQRGRLIVERLNELGLNISFDTVEEVAGGSIIGRPHIAEALLQLGQTSYYEEAFHRYIGVGGPAYVPKAKLTPPEALRLVHQAGGVAVMAHPFVADMYQHTEYLAGLGLDGIEAYHYTMTAAQTKQARHLAERFRLVVTGGSDFHGRTSSEAPIGSQRVPARLLDSLKQRAEQIRGHK
jgi:predicted metal-dependent phosphoesterase TrpH